MEKVITVLLIIFLFAFVTTKGQEIPVPQGYQLIESTKGDLDKDGIEELVVAYNMGDEDEVNGTDRELIIYKLDHESWVMWKKSNSAILNSRDGGMMGDPLEEIAIENGILLISHFGGSSWKWGYTDKYRYQNNDFQLIGHTSNYGKVCEYWAEIDFNLSTGQIIYNKEFEKCEDEEQEVYKKESETFFKKGISISLTNRHDQEVKIKSPKYGEEFYL